LEDEIRGRRMRAVAYAERSKVELQSLLASQDN
jgi:hypothetical protein